MMGQLLQQKYTDIAYPGKFDHNLQYNTYNSFKIRCHVLEGEPAMVLEPVSMEYKR